MHRLAITLGLMACLVIAPAHAQESSTVVFGSTNCRTKVPCPNGENFINYTAMADIANACLLQDLGMKTDGGFFETLGTADNCLEVKPDLLATKTAKSLFPRCCIRQMPDKSCIIRCDITNNW